MVSLAEETIVPVSDVIHKVLAREEGPSTLRALTDTVLGDIVFEMDVQTLTGDFQLLGVEFDGAYFYVTGANGGADPNKIYVIDTFGAVLMELDQIGLSEYWGWRDLAWDGTYVGPDGIDTLFGSYGRRIDKFGIRFLDSTLVHYGSFQGPAYPLNRALAYRRDSTWFYTSAGDTVGPIYKFNKTGNVIDTCPNDWFMYGAAYDSDVSEGGCVWWHSQDATGTPFYCLIEQMDAVSLDFTGLVFDYVPSTITSGIAGGLCFYEGFRGMDVLFALVQGDPADIVVGIFLRHHQPGITEGYDGTLPQLRNVISCWPNPAHGCVTISYYIERADNVSLSIYDETGRLMRVLKDEYNHAGVNTMFWDYEDNHGYTLPPGVYFVKLKTTNRSLISKVILFK